MSDKYSIVLIDDHPIIHDGLRVLLANNSEFELVGDVFSAEEAFDFLEQRVPDLAIVDLSLGSSDGIYMIQKLRKRYPRLLMLVYTMSEERLFSERCATAGANGYIMKTSPPAELKKAISIVLSG